MKTHIAIHISGLDNCVTVTEAVEKGDLVRYVEDGQEKETVAVDSCPAWHKIAARTIEKDAFVMKYGSPIGRAAERIEPGMYVHVHNVLPL